MGEFVADALIRHCEQNGDAMFNRILSWLDSSVEITRTGGGALDPKSQADMADLAEINEQAKRLRFLTLARLNVCIEKYLMQDPEVRDLTQRHLGQGKN